MANFCVHLRQISLNRASAILHLGAKYTCCVTRPSATGSKLDITADCASSFPSQRVVLWPVASVVFGQLLLTNGILVHCQAIACKYTLRLDERGKS